MHDIDDYPSAAVVPGLMIYRYDSPLFFANAENFRLRALAAVDDAEAPVRWFVLNTEAISEVDITATDALEELRKELDRRGIVFGIARMKEELRDALSSTNVHLARPARTYAVGPDLISDLADAPWREPLVPAMGGEPRQSPAGTSFLTLTRRSGGVRGRSVAGRRGRR